MGWRPPRRMKWGKVGPWSPGPRRGGNGTASPSPIWHGSYRPPALLPQSTPSKLGRTKLLRALTTSLARRRAMERVIERGAGLDVHKKSVTACVRVPGPEGGRRQEVQTFGTTAAALLALADWLAAHGVTHVAMESTGVYWKPVYNLLEGGDLELLVVNARHIKAVPGRKTDVKDAEWIADLLRHGLLRGSFIPDRPQRELRELVRYRRRLIQERAQVVNRIQQVLEGANIQLSSVATDITGASGREMLKALAEGDDDPQHLAALAKGRLRNKGLEL